MGEQRSDPSIQGREAPATPVRPRTARFGIPPDIATR